MSVQVIKVPDIGEGIAQVELVAWYVKPGDTVAEDQALADVMTDKATVEIPSPVAGQVVELGGEVGQVLAVGAELIRIERNGLPSEARSAKEGPLRPDAPDGASTDAPSLLGTTAPLGVELPSLELPSLELEPVTAEARGSPSSSFPAEGRKGEGPGVSAPDRASATRPIASPAVRARAWELGVDLSQVPATGPGGRILRADVEAYAERHGTREPARAAAPLGEAARTAPANDAARAAPANDALRPGPANEAASSGRTEEVRIIGLRRMIAQKMQEAKRRIPHYSYVEEVDVTEVQLLREQLNEQWGEPRGRLTLLPFLIQAIVRAVREFPQVNARFDDDAGVLTRYDAVHVGVATQTEAGLMVPVLRDAQARDLWSCAAEIARLAGTARSGRATREELAGSTITVTSLGRLGGIMSTPVINHPEVAIVGVNRIVERPVIFRGAVAARQMMNLSSSFDHRVIDGAMAAGFIQHVRAMLERPATLFIR